MLKENHISTGFSKLWFITLLVVCGHEVFSQVYYSTRRDYLKVKTEQNNLVTKFNPSYPDTSIDGAHQYATRNYLGNVGLPSPVYAFGARSNEPGFALRPEPYSKDKIFSRDVQYFKSAGPYADLTGVAGNMDLEMFKMLFTTTLRDKLNFTLRFNRYRSKGFYRSQQTFVNNAVFSSNYTSSSRRSGYYAYFLNNSNKNQENGGIADTSLKESNLLISKFLVPVRLSSAANDNRQNNLMLNPWLRLNRRSDSTVSGDHFLQLKSMVSFNSFRYLDHAIAKDKYYGQILLDSALTKDSTNLRQLVNEAGYNFQARNGSFSIGAGYRNELNRLWQQRDSVFMNQLITADLVIRAGRQDSAGNKSIVSALGVRYVFDGPNKENYLIESRTRYDLFPSKKIMLFLTLSADKKNPDHIYNRWMSNHFTWKNNFRQQERTSVETGIMLGRMFRVSVIYQSLNHLLYFDKNALPAQYNGYVENTGVTVSFTKVFFRHLGVAFENIIQNTNAPEYVRVPPNIFTGRLFYTGALFKRNLLLQIGGQVQRYSSFRPYAYMPATQAFYLQDKFNSTDYPYLDVYLNARIRPVTFFVKLENVLQGYMGSGYTLTPGYPQPDRALRYGLTWMFFD
jgi:hypothetical protein